MSSKTNSERAKEWRAEQQAKKASAASERDEVIAILRDQVADLKDQREELRTRCEQIANSSRTETERIANGMRTLTEQLANVAAELASIRAGIGGFGGSRSGSPSSHDLLKKDREAQEFQDLNGETRGSGVLSNGTRVPGRLGDEENANAVRSVFAMTPNAVANGTTEQQPIVDSPKTETRARGTLLGPPLLGELSEDEVERRRHAGLNGLAKLEGKK